MNGDLRLATLSLSTADVAVLVWGKTLQVSGKLGSLSLSNDAQDPTRGEVFRQILSIEGQNFAEFRYQTYDPDEAGYNGIKSTVSLTTASLKLHFLEQPLHDIYFFLVKFARLKGLYDAATQAAVQSAPQMDRMHFDISVKSPIVVIPFDPVNSQDSLVLRLGEITARNKSEVAENKISASLTGIQLVSHIRYGDELSTLKIIDDINVTAEVTQAVNVDRTQVFDIPDNQVCDIRQLYFIISYLVQVAVKISDVKLHLTQVQYIVLMNLAQSIPRVLAGAPEGYAQAESAASSVTTPLTTPDPDSSQSAGLAPELIINLKDGIIWPTVDLVVAVNSVKLHLYDGNATTVANLKEHGITRFALNQSELRLKMLSDSSGEAQVVLKSFTMSNTRAGQTRFREIIPAAHHDRNQFMVLYTTSGGTNGSSLAIVTIDSPQVIFAVDPIFALVDFFTSFNSTAPSTQSEPIEAAPTQEPQSQSSFDFRLDLHDVSINVLENDSNPETQSIILTIKQIMLSQQVRFIYYSLEHLAKS